MTRARSGRIVISGANGMLGRAFARELGLRGVGYCGATHAELDISDSRAVFAALRPGDCVLNCAAYTSVDAAESEPELAHRVNAVGPRVLAEACDSLGALLVHFSTDYVFDGEAARPYTTSSAPCPLNVYGHSKLLGEQCVMGSSCEHLVIRTSWLYAPWGSSFVLTLARLLRERALVRVVADQRGTPTSALWLAQATLRLLELEQRGLFHVTDGGECSRFELARSIRSLLCAPALVEPCSSGDFPTPARRPSYSVLDVTEMEHRLGPAPHFEANLAQVLRSEAVDG